MGGGGQGDEAAWPARGLTKEGVALSVYIIESLLPRGKDNKICREEVVITNFDNISNNHMKPLNPEPIAISKNFYLSMIDLIISAMAFLVKH